jgi:hypothetical protein
VDPAVKGAVRVEAVVADLFRERASRPLTGGEIAGFSGSSPRPKEISFKARRRHLEIILVACWLLYDDVFQGSDSAAMLRLLGERCARLAPLVLARAFVEDPERREELVRACLSELGRVPRGETPEGAEDRLTTLDSVRRDRLLRETRAREEEREKRRKELERLRQQEEEERRKAARTTFED